MVVLFFKPLSILFSVSMRYLLSTYPPILNNLFTTYITHVFNADMELSGADMESMYSLLKNHESSKFFLSKTLQTQYSLVGSTSVSISRIMVRTVFLPHF